MSLPNHQPDDNSRTVNVRGRRRPFIERRRVRGRDYCLLERIGSPFRERYLAFDPQAPGGDYFLLQTWPSGPATQQYLRVLRRIKDDCLPRTVDCQRRTGHVDVVLTWAEGISLAQYFENINKGRREPVSPREAVRLVHGLANAVCKLVHNRQVAHGDIQPPNLIITGHTSRLVLIDFGSAWPTDTTRFRETGDGLHRCYAAPELQMPGTPVVGFFADQFSVSVLLFELLTQQLPYGGIGGKAGRPEYVNRARNSLLAPSKVSPACANLPRLLRERVDRVTVRGLALEPQDRYPDRHAWLNDLFDVYARFRLPPELPPVEAALTRVIRWFVKLRPAK